MRFNLAAMTRRVHTTRRRAIVIRDIAPPAMLATDLYRSVYAPICAIWERAAEGIVAAYQQTLDVHNRALDAASIASAGHSDSNLGLRSLCHTPAAIGLVSADTIWECEAGGLPPVTARLTDSPREIQAQVDAADGEFERLFMRLTAALDEWSIRVERWQRLKWRDAVLTATGVDLLTLIGPEEVRETVETYLRWNVELIRDVSDQARQRISNAVFSGLQNRTPARDLAKQIREAVDMSRRRSVGIASDQMSKMTSALADERRRQAGLSVWKWRHSGKRHPREKHRARDGRLYADDPAMAGREVDGVTLEAAPAENDRPGRPPWCGCRGQGVLVLD